MAKRKKAAKKIVLPKVSVPKVKLPKLNKKNITIAVLVIVLALILFLLKGLFVAATVNGYPITRLALVKELEKSNGSSVLQSLITKELIAQEARRNSVVVTKADIDAEIAKIEETIKAQGQTLEEALLAQGWTRADLEDQIKTQKIVEKLLADKVTITDQEIENYIKENKSTDPREAIEAQLKQQKLFEAYQAWIAELMAKAKISYWVKY